VDPDGLEAFGLSLGGEIGFFGRVGGGSVTFALDTNGSFSIIGNVEAGRGTPGFEAFARGVFGFGDNTVDSLAGPGASVSANAGRYSASVSLPYRYTPQDCEKYPLGDHGFFPPVVELGLGRGQAGISLTGSYGTELYRSDFLGNLFR